MQSQQTVSVDEYVADLAHKAHDDWKHRGQWLFLVMRIGQLKREAERYGFTLVRTR